jgi:hypothetical protein
VQARELTAHFALASMDLINRPNFWTYVSPDRKQVVIGGTTDAAPLFPKFDREGFGHMMAAAFPTPPRVVGKTPEEVVAGGHWSLSAPS